MNDDKKIDDELYKKIEWFCDIPRVEKLDKPQQIDYNACMKIAQRMKDVGLL